ncbi:MAG TPA: hypothetical protein ENK05_02135 [Gammaproteobacteria bacterium]|nr:hypothetical protein [Gammaproteobacteria bacterium]
MTKIRRDPIEALGEAYELMLERAMEGFRKLTGKSGPALHEEIDKARDTAVERGELSQEDADKVAGYLKRDLGHAARYRSETGKELKDWLGFEVDLIENEIFDLFMQAADKTTVELLELKEMAELASTYHTGEIAGPGTLVCENCGEKLHFRKAGRIPPCPKCHGTVFRRPEQ